jgi:hypothetical protein
MSEFKVQQKTEGANLHLILNGNIDEDVQFPIIDTTGISVLLVDLKEVKAINSVGIREWLNWIRPLSEKAKIELFNCPKALVFQLNMVEGFLPKGGVVKSFFVPFFCEKCDREENILFTLGKEIEAAGGNYAVKFNIQDANLCKEPACEMAMDATEAKYFQFLKKMA